MPTVSTTTTTVRSIALKFHTDTSDPDNIVVTNVYDVTFANGARIVMGSPVTIGQTCTITVTTEA